MTDLSQPSATNEYPALATERADDVFVARQPIFDRSQRLHAYELLFRGGLENFCLAGDPNQMAGDVLQAAWLTFGLSTLVGQCKAFTNFTRDLLVAGYAEALPVESTVIELLETVDGDPEVVKACQNLKQKGYTLALDDFVYRPALDPLIPLANVIKVRFRDSDPQEQEQHIRRLASQEVELLAEAVETHDEYRRARELGFSYFQGYFFQKPEVIKGRTLSGSHLTYLRLLQSVTRPDLNIDEVEAIVRTDASVTHRLMKYLGSAAFALRAEINSVRHGLVLLGKEQTRRFVSLVALGEMGSHKPPELLVNAAVRARFCELLGEDAGMADRKPDLFLLGVLSLLDAMLDQPMSKILEELPLAADLKRPVRGELSPLYPVLAFVERYERGEWASCSDLGRTLKIAESQVFDRYTEAVAWGTKALKG